MKVGAFVAVAAVGAAVAEKAYRRWLRVRVLTWGATAEEATAPLPGDDLLAADIVATRAIRIDAPPSAIWPWLVQMGPGRAGAYTYDFIENLFGLDMHSADRIRPEWQELGVGDVIRGREDRPAARNAGHGAWLFDHGAQDASGDQGTRRAPRGRGVLAQPLDRDPDPRRGDRFAGILAAWVGLLPLSCTGFRSAPVATP